MNWDYLLFYRWLALNVTAFAILGVFHMNGMVEPVFLADSSYIVYVITGLFLYGMVLCGYRVWKTSRELNFVKRGDKGKLKAFADRSRQADRESVKEAFEIKLFARISFVKYISSSLVMLGLLGTVIGFIMVLTNIPANAVGDAAQVGKLVGALTNGMGVALYTTLVGAITNLWLNANYNMLRTGVVNLIAAILESADPQ
ncbi:MAG: MotA/TolQ/ExbB proton channel family protein [Thiobacillus sp.]|uniref:MotA/TolQ/ExbB proton channel family protein n=1 Tax=Thiobacillus sp. TaxID=924 RepID=UPI0028962A3D|nr:MotA/TolQ/ExbB proton channel family protein [Thiobacillus sp.]MDT3705702.1 MotA/TolQ/ExbB proton channel family protein [Thiobacillus sp.]